MCSWLASWRVDSVDTAEFEDASRGRPFTRGVGLPGRIYADGSSHWIVDIAADTNFPRSPFALKANLRSGFGFAITLGEEISGVMEFFTRERQTSDPNLLEVMTAIGNQIGQFVERKHAEEERAQIYEREQRARLEVETAIERMRQVQTAPKWRCRTSLDKCLPNFPNACARS